MEDFTCWWHPLDNLTGGEEVTYLLTYSKDKGPKHECPDYTTGGPNSCHFDRSHTSVWTSYCMNVTAITPQGNYTSKGLCLDVADIVETEAPINLTSVLTDAGKDETGHNVRLSWVYPKPEDLQYGWITLEYELQYRQVTEPDSWKVKHPLREPHVELLGLRVGEYVVRVRSRSHNNGLWSKWSSPLLMSIPDRLSSGTPTGKVLVLILVVGVGVVALLVFTFGIMPHSKRIKEYFLPPIPKPRIMGIDPLLLKKGHLEEINRHFSNFHGYRPPSYSEEAWDQVSADDLYLAAPKDLNALEGALKAPGHLTPGAAAARSLPIQNPMAYVQSVSPYCTSPPEAFAPLLDAPPPWHSPEIVSVPGTDYSMMEHPGLASGQPAAFMASHSAPQDFYTCVELLKESGEVHLVPCLPPAYCGEFLPFPSVDLAAKDEQKKLVEFQARITKEAERSEATVPLLPVSVADTG
ncbi:prolactin receptor isoform X2 [Oryzias melastigma]|nr:prolactin receptor isoform X2 [Oryzias melastigma]XP_036070707.1 prolactin receptor isoform X2 [Oryzias melastigma]